MTEKYKKHVASIKLSKMAMLTDTVHVFLYCCPDRLVHLNALAGDLGNLSRLKKYSLKYLPGR